MIGRSLVSQSRTASWLTPIPRRARISLRQHGVSRNCRRQNTTKAMMSLGRQVRFSTPALRSLSCRPQVWQRKRRYPCAVSSGRSVTAADPQQTQFIPIVHLSSSPAALRQQFKGCQMVSGASADRTVVPRDHLGLSACSYRSDAIAPGVYSPMKRRPGRAWAGSPPWSSASACGRKPGWPPGPPRAVRMIRSSACGSRRRHSAPGRGE